MIKSFLCMLGLFTTIKVPDNVWTKKAYEKGVAFIPLVGVIISFILYLFMYILKSNVISGVLLFLVYVLITGGIHIDGFCDSVDGFFSRRDKKRTLEIMKDSNIGTFGVLGLIIYILVFIFIYPELRTIIVFAPIISRTFLILLCSISDYAREEGMGKDIINNSKISYFVFYLILLVLFLFFILKEAIISLIVIFVYALILSKYSKKKIGGITGDVMGFFIETSQLLYMITMYLMVILWRF